MFITCKKYLKKNTSSKTIVHACHNNSNNEEAPHDNSHSIKGYFYLKHESHRLLTFKQKIGLTNLLRVKSWLRLWILLIHGSEWCAFCQLQISQWEAGDTGFGEHMRWNSACPYIRGKTVFNFTQRTELEKIEGARFYSMCIMHWEDIRMIWYATQVKMIKINLFVISVTS